MQKFKLQNGSLQIREIQGLHLDEAGEAASSGCEMSYLDRPFIWERHSSGYAPTCG